jgi:biotin carboxyl carrier protein
MADAPQAPTAERPTAHMVSSTGTDRLDSLITTTKPRGWWALAAIAVSVVVIIIWSIVAVIPQQVRTTGVVTAVDLVKVVAAPTDGSVEILASPGDTVESSQPVAKLTPYDGSPEITLTAPATGILQSQLVQQGAGVLMGEEILKVREPASTERGQIVVAYLSSSNAVHFQLGDEPQIIITDVASGSTEQTTATVVRIDNVPSSLVDMAIVLGSITEAEEAAKAAGGQPYGILMRIEGDGNEAGLEVLQPGEVVEVVQTYAEVHPIQLLFGGT